MRPNPHIEPNWGLGNSERNQPHSERTFSVSGGDLKVTQRTDYAGNVDDRYRHVEPSELLVRDADELPDGFLREHPEIFEVALPILHRYLKIREALSDSRYPTTEIDRFLFGEEGVDTKSDPKKPRSLAEETYTMESAPDPRITLDTNVDLYPETPNFSMVLYNLGVDSQTILSAREEYIKMYQKASEDGAPYRLSVMTPHGLVSVEIVYTFKDPNYRRTLSSVGSEQVKYRNVVDLVAIATISPQVFEDSTGRVGQLSSYYVKDRSGKPTCDLSTAVNYSGMWMRWADDVLNREEISPLSSVQEIRDKDIEKANGLVSRAMSPHTRN